MTEGLKPNTLTADEHIAAILQTHKISRKELLGPARLKRLMTPRRELFVRLVFEPKKFCNGEPVYRTLPQVGRIVGRRDHSTVYYNLRRWSSEMFGTPHNARLEQMRSIYRDAQNQQEIAA